MKQYKYLLAMFAIIVWQSSFAQNPPVKQWHWSGNYNNNIGNFNLVENWFYHVISTSDGGYVGLGFTLEKVGGVVTYINPSAVKVDANGNQVWSTYYNEGNAATEGFFSDGIEVSDGYVLMGSKADPNHSLLASIYVIKVNKNTGAKIASKFYNSDPAVLPGYSSQFPNATPVGNSIRPIYTTGTLTGYILAGTNLCIPNCSPTFAQSSRGMVLVKTDQNFNIDPAFAQGGWGVYNRNGSLKASEQTNAEQVRVMYNNNNPLTGSPNAFVVTGSTINSISVTDRDACILKTDLTGAQQWIKSYSDNQSTGCDYFLGNTAYSGGYVDVGPDNNCCTDAIPVNENLEEAAGDFEQTSTTEATILATFDISVGFPPAGSTNCHALISSHNGSYIDNDAVLFRIDLATGAPKTNAPAPTNIMHNGTIDFKPRMVMDATYFYACGGNCTDPNYLSTDIVKINRSNLSQVWKQAYIAQNSNTVNCTFGLALCLDGGIIFGGNNELNDEDYFLTKLYSDCQTNLTGLTYNGGFIAPAGITTWGAGTKTIRGVVRVPNGATLRINSGAVIRFADTRRYNDYDFLANNAFNYTSAAARNSQPTKIIVERGGRLEIDGSTTVLRGLNVCGGEAMWEGIEVFGLSTVNQSPNTNQGFMQVTNGALIENMYAGITVGRNAFDSKGQTAHITSSSTDGGGILKMSGASKIKNSRYGVFFFPYPTGTGSFNATNQSIFTGALFECSGTQPLVDVNYVDNQGNKLGTDIFVFPVMTNTIRFSADCKFIGNSNLLVKHRGIGIRNGDASISVTGTLTTGINNFSDLLYGIYSGKVFSTRAIYVSANRFNNCARASYLKGGAYGGFYNNEVYVPVALLSGGYAPYGFYLDGTPNLSVSGNDFLGLGSGVTSDNNVGLIVSDHGTTPSSVWDNDFGKSGGTNGLFIGAQPQRTNGISGTNPQGLQINCNRFNTGNYYDWTVTNSTPSILPAQGQGSLPAQTQAGNVFNDGLPCTVPFENINSTYAFTYYYRNPPAVEFPNCKTTNLTTVQAIQPNNNTCVPDPPCNDPSCASGLRTRMNAETDAVKKEILRNSLFIYYIAVADSPQTAIDLLTPLGTDDAKKRLVTAYIYMQQYSNAQSTLNSIASSNAENTDFKTLHQILLDLASVGQTIYNMTGTQTTTITAIANGTTSNKYAAQVILSIAKGNVYTEIIDNFGGGGGTRSSDPAIADINLENSFVMFPNPANSQLTIQLNSLPGITSKVTVQMFDVSGKLVLADEHWNNEQQFYNLNISNIDNGIYFVNITVNNTMLGTHRVVINH